MNTTSDTTGRAGRLLAGIGAVLAALVWAPRAAFSIDGGFEAHARDLSVLFVDLPLIVLGGALVPFLTWSLTGRWTSQALDRGTRGGGRVRARTLGTPGVVDPSTAPGPRLRTRYLTPSRHRSPLLNSPLCS